MKLAKLAGSAVAFLFTMTAFAAAYDSSWYTAPYWSGEYPNGISVIEEGVVIPARAAMDEALPANISCAVPFRAVYHQWNQARPASFMTASKIIPMTATEDLKIGDTGEVTVAAGETFEYLIYGAEGYFTVRYKGQEYVGNQDIFEKVSYDKDLMENNPQQEWLNITCVGGENAWIHMNTLLTMNQDGEYTYPKGLDSWFRGFRDYGVVTDLTDQDLK